MTVGYRNSIVSIGVYNLILNIVDRLNIGIIDNVEFVFEQMFHYPKRPKINEQMFWSIIMKSIVEKTSKVCFSFYRRQRK